MAHLDRAPASFDLAPDLANSHAREAWAVVWKGNPGNMGLCGTDDLGTVADLRMAADLGAPDAHRD